MKYFIGIIPSEKVKESILDFQKSIKNNSYPYLFEPHITVKAPGGLTEDLQWIDKIKERLSSFPCFSVYLDGVSTFEENGVVFLVPGPKDKIKELHKTLFDIIDSKKTFEFEDEDYHSHLTLAGVKWGISMEQILDITSSAEIFF